MFPQFPFLIVYYWVLFLFILMSAIKGFSTSLILSEDLLLISLIFCIVLLNSILFISTLIFIISSLLLTLGFVSCSFSSSFRYKVRLFIWDFSCFFFKILFIYLVLERGQGRKTGRKTQISCLLHTTPPGTEPTTQARALTGNRTDSPLLCGMTPNQLSHTSQCKVFLVSWDELEML